jgi:predicted DCC family thiol-disulfide oxidoreductase YuxK
MKPYQWLDLTSLGLNQEVCRKQIQFVVSSELRFSGARAFANFLIASPMPWKVLGYFMTLPLINHISSIVYKWIAANRYRLPGGKPTCKMPKTD